MAKTKDQKPQNQASYTAKDIYVLEGLEPVRKRPGMYIGSTGVDGLHHLIWEVFDNSLDEAMAGYAKNIEINLLSNNRVRVKDDGRGIPVEKHKQTGVSALETVMTTLHAGGKFGGESYKVAAGLHGVGVSVVNALSIYLKAEVCRDGGLYEQEYIRGEVKRAVKKVGTCKGSGTTVTFEPDPEIFKEILFDWHQILNHIRQQAYLTKGVRIKVSDEREPIKIEKSEKGKEHEHVIHPSYGFFFEGGITSYVNFLNRHEETVHPNIFYTAKEQDQIFVEVALQYTGELQGRELSFANNVHTIEGGMHLTGFRSAITRTLNDNARKNGLLKEKDENLTGEDVREGLTAIISVKIASKALQFEGQTKAKLGNTEARTAVENIVNTELADWLERNPSDARSIMGKVLLASKARLAAKAAKENVIRKGALEGFTLPGKLADCSSKIPEESELFIVEGDSAGGCFSGDTRVALLDGRNVAFKDLVEEARQGKKNFCYTINHYGHIAVAPILNPRITVKNARVVRVVLDSGENIDCTPDHKFMLRDGQYEEARNLQPNDSLMPLYRQFSRLGKRITIKGYELVFDPVDTRWFFTHLLSDKYNLRNGAYSEKDGAHRHHKDFNKLNNNPNNIIRLSKESHFKLHQEIAATVLRSPKVLEKLRKIRQTPKFREKIRKSMLKLRPLLSARAKKQWENPKYKKYMTERFLDFYNSNTEYRKKNSETLFNNQRRYWSNDIHREQQAKKTKAYFESHPEKRIEYSLVSQKQWQNENLRNWRSQKTKEQWMLEFRAKRLLAYNKTYREKALKIFNQIYKNIDVIDINKYNEIRKEAGDRGLIRYQTILSRFFENNPEKFETAVKNYNHRVKKVVELKKSIDVYDIEVPKTHNFALASGVFVHNSSKQGRNRKIQAILPLRGKILNVEKARIDRMLASEEIRALVIAMGTAIAEEFDMSKLRYHKIVIMTDADVDGAHIRSLLLTLFYRYFRQLIESGHIYIAQPPLYRIQKGNNIQYVYSDAEKEKALGELAKTIKEKPKAATKKETKVVEGFTVSELDNGADLAAESPTGDGSDPASAKATAGEEIKISGVSIQRYKGLGEMNPSQLWETTMDPGNRVLLQVTMKDAEEADKIFDVLMGSDVLPRRKFIQAHAKNVKNLDI
ncbi:MAG: intein-containing DNA gyrase subunit B [Candidatus Yanofskybacteria bacterium]|nr:intein-containing DNA gyrase subunit B [Candidatus Yanofskybacteria bacterium]